MDYNLPWMSNDDQLVFNRAYKSEEPLIVHSRNVIIAFAIEGMWDKGWTMEDLRDNSRARKRVASDVIERMKNENTPVLPVRVAKNTALIDALEGKKAEEFVERLLLLTHIDLKAPQGWPKGVAEWVRPTIPGGGETFGYKPPQFDMAGLPIQEKALVPVAMFTSWWSSLLPKHQLYGVLGFLAFIILLLIIL
jgi:hypothetical protein